MEAKTDTTATPAADHPNRAELVENFRHLATLMRQGADVMSMWETVAKRSDVTRLLAELNVLGAVERLVKSDGNEPLLNATEVIDLRVLSFVAQGTFRDQGVVEMGPDPLAPAECPAKAEALS